MFTINTHLVKVRVIIVAKVNLWQSARLNLKLGLNNLNFEFFPPMAYFFNRFFAEVDAGAASDDGSTCTGKRLFCSKGTVHANDWADAQNVELNLWVAIQEEDLSHAWLDNVYSVALSRRK